jgi:hypothetical protein
MHVERATIHYRERSASYDRTLKTLHYRIVSSKDKLESTIKMLELWHGKGYVKHNKTQKLKMRFIIKATTGKEKKLKYYYYDHYLQIPKIAVWWKKVRKS